VVIFVCFGALRDATRSIILVCENIATDTILAKQMTEYGRLAAA